MGILYLVATPIGNLDDITFRAIETLKSVDLILCEDTRVTKKLLEKYGIHTLTESYHQHTGGQKKEIILRDLLLGKNIALVTDAGTPGISDPGNELIDYITSGSSEIKVVPIPGPSALTAALSVSGLNVNKFIFLGFMPKKGRTKLFAWLKESEMPFVFYESPYRLIKTLEAVKNDLGEDRVVFVARELTKAYESLYRGTLKEVIETLSKDKVKGEVVVVVSPPRIELGFKV